MARPRPLRLGLPGGTAAGALAALMTALVVGQLPSTGAVSPAPTSSDVAVVRPASDDLAVPAAPALQSTPVDAPAPLPPPVAPLLPAPPAAAAALPPVPEVAMPPAPLPPAPAAAPGVPPPAVPAPPAAARAADPGLAGPATPAPPVAANAGAAPAAGADLCSGPGWEQRRGAAALASLRGGAARTGFTVTFHPARSGYMGMTFLHERRIEVYVRSCDRQPMELLRHVMAHELGHAWDTTQMSGAERTAFLVARGIPATTGWYGCSGCTDFATPAGDFAEVYAQWARGAAGNKSLLAGDVSGPQLSALASRFFGA